MLFHMRKKYRLAIVFVIASSLLMCVVYGSDIQKHWANNQIQEWVGYGVIKGYKNGDFKPDHLISRAEFVVLINRVLGNEQTADKEFKDISTEEWFYNDIQKGIATGYISGFSDGTIKPNEPITRQEAAIILASAFGLEDSESNLATEFKDSSQIASWAKSSVNTMVAHQVINGYADKTFKPTKKLTRAESVAMLDKLCGAIYAPSDKIDGVNVEGSLLINQINAVLPELKIAGNLFITEGVTSNALLKNLAIEKNLYIKNIYQSNMTLIGTKAKEVVVKASKADTLSKHKGIISIEGNSAFSVINLYAPITLNITENASVNKVIISPLAAGTEINSKAVIQVIVNADNVIINGEKAAKGSSVTTSKNKKNVITSSGSSNNSAATNNSSETISSFELIDVTDGK